MLKEKAKIISLMMKMLILKITVILWNKRLISPTQQCNIKALQRKK
jgi:hypothetical protein